MKIFTFIMLALFVNISLTAQVVVINSPASLEGAYLWETGFGADLTTDVWTGNLQWVDDGSAMPNEGCNDLVNDLTGDIAIVDRGSCEFGLKALNAEMAGAIAVVICNHTPGGPIPMGGGAVGDQVTIPTVMLSLEDCDIIRMEMDGGATVNMTIGALQFDNDISTGITTVRVPLLGTIPSNQIEDPSPLETAFAPTLRVSNNGLLDANNVTATAVVDFTPTGGAATEVYNNTVNETLIPIDTSALMTLPVLDYTGSEPGRYDVSYTIAFDEDDELLFDNEVNTSFVVSDNAFSKGQWDFDNNRPVQNVGFTIAGGGPIEMISGFHIPAGEGFSIDSVTFQCSTNNPSLEGIIIKANIYEWNDLNNDSIYNNDELTLVGINNITFDDTYGTAAWVTLPVLDATTLAEGYDIPADGGYYLMGTRYEGADFVFFGFNNTYDHTITDELAIFPTFADFPYFQVTTFPGQVPDIESGGLFTDFFGTLSQAMYVNQTGIVESTKELLSEIDAQLDIYPNPASELLTAQVTLAEQTNNMVYRITDTNGRLIFNTQVENVITDKAEFNVSQLPAGQYYMTIQTDKGVRTETFTVNR